MLRYKSRPLLLTGAGVVFLILLLLLLAPRADALAQAEGSCGASVSWTLRDGVLTVSGAGPMEDFRYTDHSVSTPWYALRDDVRQVVVEEGVTAVGDYAFAYCRYVSEVSLPESLTRIGRYAFWGANLRWMELPAAVSSLDDYALCDAGLYAARLPASLKSIGEGAFSGNYSFKNVYYEGSAAQWAGVLIGAKNEALTNAALHDVSAPFTGSSGSCGYYTSWTLSADGTLTISGRGTTEDYKSASEQPWAAERWRIRSVVVEEGVERIGNYFLNGCFRVKELSLPQSLTALGNQSLRELMLSSLTIPDGVTELGTWLLAGCRYLRAVRLPAGITKLPAGLFSDCQTLEDVTIPEGVSSIGESSFYSCMNLSELVIPSTVTKMDDFVFVNCYELKTLCFEGPLPAGVNGSLLQSNGELAIRCREEYCDDFVALRDFTTNSVVGPGIVNNVCVYTGERPVKLTAGKLTLSADKPTAYVYPAEAEEGAEIRWLSADPAVAQVDDFGKVQIAGHGRTILYAEIRESTGVTMTSCLVSAQYNGRLVGLLPTEGLTADFPVICSTSYSSSLTGELSGYAAAKLAEQDVTNALYQEILAQTRALTSGLSDDYEKAKAIQKWVSGYVSYGGSLGIGDHVDTIYSVWLNRASHCQGYSYLTGLMLYMADIPSGLVTCPGHMYNVALLNGRWVMLDSTWNRFDFDYEDEEYGRIDSITFGEGNCCMIVSDMKGVMLAGVGNHSMEREDILSVTVPDYVSVVFGMSFSDCKGLEEVTLPAGLKSIRSEAFADCRALRDVYYKGTRAEWSAVEIGGDNAPLLAAQLHCTGSAQYLPGDASGDGKVNGRDGMLLFRHLLGMAAEVEPSALDANGDGAADLEDVRFLFARLSGAEDSLS